MRGIVGQWPMLVAAVRAILSPLPSPGWPGFCACTRNEGAYTLACHLRVGHLSRTHLDRSRGEWQDWD
jgi:hypothetical protein